MGLYLAVFADDDEVDGVEVGSYDDFSHFRNAVVEHLEQGVAGSRFPTLILHSDCDGEWTAEESATLESELLKISNAFRSLPPAAFNSAWKAEVAKSFALSIKTFYDCLFDVDGEPLLERLVELTRLSQDRGAPILFQ